jgi:hypothetical protein
VPWLGTDAGAHRTARVVGREVERKPGTGHLICMLGSHANGISARPPPQPGRT